MTKKIKIISAVASLVIGAAVVTTVSLAVFTDRKVDDATLQTGNVAISAVLEGSAQSGDTVTTGQTVSLKVADGKSVNAVVYDITSTGSKRSYVRAQVIPIVQNYNGSEWITATDVSIKDINVYVASANDAVTSSWIYSDGYYYYPNVVNADAALKAYIGSDVITDSDTRVIYDVDIQASQATHDAYIQNWGTALPAGVEKLQSADGYR